MPREMEAKDRELRKRTRRKEREGGGGGIAGNGS